MHSHPNSAEFQSFDSGRPEGVNNISLPDGQVIHTYRNDAGHASGNPVGTEDAEMILSLFPNYTRRLYGFKSFFDTHSQTV